MTALGRIRAAFLTVALATLPILGAGVAAAQSPGYLKLTAGDELMNRPIYLGQNKSVVIELPQAAGDVLVSNPAIADAVLRTNTRLYLMGMTLGQANVFLFNSAGEQFASFDIFVEADLSALNQILTEAIPDGYVRADALNGSIVLRGQVTSSTDASRAVEITQKMIAAQPLTQTTGSSTGNSAGTVAATTQSQTFDEEDGAGVVNLLSIMGEEQVTLKVTVAEVQRQVIKQLGFNISGNFADGGFTGGSDLGLSPIGPNLGVSSTAGQVALGFSGANGSIAATLQALDETNMIRTLAEPTLTAVSGETANFLAGGEFGYQTFDDEEDDDGGVTRRVTVAFRPFGVGLAFTPVVLSSGRISLRVRTEVSEISGTTFGIPSLNTRRAETTVELPSGGSFTIGGLVQESTRRTAGGFPGLQNLPVLGALFSSKSFRDDQTELVMIVTAYLVKPTSPEELARPDDNLMMANDAEGYFLNRLNKVYGRASAGPSTAAAGKVGFTFD